MKAIKLINLFIMASFCQVVFSQNDDIVKSFDLRRDKSVLFLSLCDSVFAQSATETSISVVAPFEMKPVTLFTYPTQSFLITDYGAVPDNPADYLPAVITSWEGMECYNYSPLLYAFGCELSGGIRNIYLHDT